MQLHAPKNVQAVICAKMQLVKSVQNMCEHCSVVEDVSI